MPISDLRSVRHLSLSQIRTKEPALADELAKLLGAKRKGPRKQKAAIERPIGEHPVVNKLIEEQRIGELLRIAKVPERTRAAVQKATVQDGIDDTVLARLVASRALTEAEAHKLGIVSALAELADGDAVLAETLDANVTKRFGRAIADVRDLATLTAADWRAALGGARLPDGVTVDSAAEAIAGRIATAFPGPVLAARLPRPSEAELARKAPAELAAIAASYPGLDLDATFADASIPAATRAATAAKRMQLVSGVLGALDTTSLLELDLTPDGLDRAALGFDKLGADAADEARAVKTLKAYQRVVAVTETLDDAAALVARGFSSSLAIANLSFEQFAQRSGFAADKARRAYDSALAGLTSSTLTTAGIFDATVDNLGLTAVNNVRPALVAKLKGLPGYEALFGKLSLCACEECSSILGAAAYFVDLMKFVDDNIRDQLKSKPNHVLDIKTRRPDLWDLRLTCANVNDRIPTLDIVNEILENHIARDLGYAGSLTARSAIRAIVYPKLAGTVDSFQQPFHYPLARLESYLKALGGDRRAIAVATGASDERQAQATLGISAVEWPLLVEPKLALLALSKLYTIPLGGTPAAVDPIEATTLVSAVGLDRTRLGEAIATAFVKAGAPTAKIVASKSSSESVQNDIERVVGLTASGLDRLHRLVRLQRRLPWSFAELDRVLTAIGTAAFDGAALIAIAKLRVLELRLGLKVDELCAMIGQLPLVPAGESLFDRRFNPPSFVAADGALPDANRKFVDPALRTTTPASADPALPRLVAGLALDLAKLSSLIRHLAPHLARVGGGVLDIEAPNDDDRQFALSHANLSLLYRHAVVARKLSVSIDDLFLLLSFAGFDFIGSLDALEALLDLHAWWKSTRYKLDEIAIALGRAPRDPALDELPAAIATEIVAAAADALVVNDTLFAVSPGVSEAASKELVAANAALFETLEGAEATSYRLRPDVDLDAIALVIPPSAQIRDATQATGVRPPTEAELKAALRPHVGARHVIGGIAGALRIAADKVEQLIAMTGIAPGSPEITSALAGGPIEPLVTLVASVRTLAIVFVGAAWTGEALVTASSTPALFGAPPLPLLSPTPDHPRAPWVSLEQLRALSVYARLATRIAVIDGAVTPIDPAAVREALLGFDPAAQAFSLASEPAVARALGVPLAMIIGLRGRVQLAPVAAEALDRLERATQLASALGVDGDTFGGIAGANFEELDRVADALVAALRERNPDEETRAKVTDAAEQPIREAQRDALCDFMLHSVTPRPWKSVDDLYKYFLIDVDAGGCSSTSRVVAAISSVQLYVHRVQMNLEQDTLPPSNAQHATLRLPADAAEEWTWRQNYRVWQANRKVFLWPENYIEPDLRDDKTPQFRDLEDELLQKDIDDQNVLDAYTRYLASFEEVASLLVAGAYHERKRHTDTLHLIGVAPQDPPVYYYRSCRDLIQSGRDPKRGAVWTPWQKISVQIPGRRVAPIVHNGRLHVFWATLRTKPISKLVDGKSVFNGYSHHYDLSFTTLRADGTWTAPQPVKLPQTYWFWPSNGEVLDELLDGVPELDPLRRVHEEAIDDYTVSGVNWDGLWPTSKNGELFLRTRDFHQVVAVDLFARVAVSDGPGFPSTRPTFLCAKDGDLYFGKPLPLWESAGAANFVIDARRLDIANLEEPIGDLFKLGLYQEQIAKIPSDAGLLAIPGAAEDAIVQVGDDVLLVQGTTRDDDHYQLRRIGTTLARTIARKLFEDGFDALLDTETQLALAEHGLPITLVGSRIDDTSNSGTLDFTGPYGVYYRELFFHIPFLIANALNSQGRFAAAQTWYHRIFDPTSTETIEIPPNMPASERAHRALDRVWRYREFRGLDITTLRDILTDKATIALYKEDPFNPFAIARSRISAFQKSIVMKYLDNILDWADDLFTQFTMESVNEALMLYVTALDILGKRPAILGDCGEGGPSPRTYASIAPLLDDSEMLIETENWGIRPGSKLQKRRPKYTFAQSALKRGTSNALAGRIVGKDQVVTRSQRMSTGAALDRIVDKVRTGTAYDENVFEEGNTIGALSTAATRTASWAPARAVGMKASKDNHGGRFVEAGSRPTLSKVGKYGWAVLRQLRPVFCVPPNMDLLAYWDRVEDRLYKIRNCMDITGQLRELALFAPPIDPRILVAARAAGLSLADVVASSRGSLPPYRFSFLIERAKAAAASLSGFGSALLAALEKRDGEELNRLRLVQQKNVATMSRALRQLDINAADAQLEASRRQLEAAEYRHEYYDNLVTSGRNTWEVLQSIGQHVSGSIYLGVGIANTVAAIMHLIPEVGSPFAMKYGGKQQGDSAACFGTAMQSASLIADSLAKSAGLEAGFERREEGWEHQRELAKHDIANLKKQVKAGEIRLDQANRSLALHEKGQEHIDEQLEIVDGKFTNLGFYTWLTQRVQSLYRTAYQNASSLARLAEQAYRFERNDTSFALEPNYWDSTRAGLLSGESLLVALQALDRRYLESNTRTLEVDQAFSMSQLDPTALIALRETGQCSFTVPEVAFDLFYPGQYRRRIKAVRLTIPCITGPYVNVGATLALSRSWLRASPAPSAALVEVPPSRSTAIATSAAQGDAGVFELSFRDERYMPFEGLGAISEWQLTLPRAFRQFDYQTITDVIVTISYTADHDGALRDRVESQNASVVGGILNYFTENAAERLFSMRQDFSAVFTRLVRSPVGTQLAFEIADRNLPLLFKGRDIEVTQATLLVRTPAGTPPTGLVLSVDGAGVTGFAPSPAFGGLHAAPLPGGFGTNFRSPHTIAVVAGGDVAPLPEAGNVSALDVERVLDLMIHVQYRLV